VQNPENNGFIFPLSARGNYPLTVGTHSSRLVDRRMGNAPRYYLGAAPAEIDMRVPDTVRKCVLFIGVRDLDESITYGGTAFVVTVPGTRGSFGYLVTAKHVLDVLGDRPFVLRANVVGGSSVILEANVSHWSFHEDATVDAAVAPLVFDEPLDLDVRAIPVSNFLNDEIIAEHRIGAGDEVFVTGLFTRTAGVSRNMPIVRMGTVALMPPEKIPHGSSLIDAYLIEHHSIGGLSGSPAFVSETAIIPGVYAQRQTNPDDEHSIFAPGQTFFMGLLRGHWEAPPNPAFGQLEGMHLGISVVVPAQKIHDIIYGKEQIAVRKHFEEQEIKNDKTGVLDHALPSKPFTKEDFEIALKKVSHKIATEKK
jgi:hypothetical protein